MIEQPTKAQYLYAMLVNNVQNVQECDATEAKFMFLRRAHKNFLCLFFTA